MRAITGLTITTLVVALSWIVSGTAWAAPPIPTYSIIDIPMLGGNCSQANAMNNRGDVVGESGESESGECSRGFFYQHSSGAVNYLTFDSQSVTTANGISDNGLIAGWAPSPQPLRSRVVAVLWSSIGGAEELQPVLDTGGTGGTFANAVNNRGLVVGYWIASGSKGGGAFVWSGPQHTEAALPQLACFNCVRDQAAASAVNDRGHIVGWSVYDYHTPPDFPAGTHAVEWHDGKITDLGELSGPSEVGGVHYSVANAINNRDDVVGTSQLGTGQFPEFPLHAFLYRRGNMIDIGTLQDDSESSAASINDRGEIVGSSGTITSTRAFIYVNGQMYDLNKLIDPTSPLADVVHLDEAVAINSRGWIAANGVDSRDGLPHSYLLIRTCPHRRDAERARQCSTGGGAWD